MSRGENQRSEVMTFFSSLERLFRCLQDDSFICRYSLNLHFVVDLMSKEIFNMSLDNSETVVFDYLQECVDNFESKDSGINLSPRFISISDLQLNGLEKDYIDHDFSSVDINVIKLENLFLQSENNLESDGSVDKIEKDISKAESIIQSANMYENISSDGGNVIDTMIGINYHELNTATMESNFKDIENIQTNLIDGPNVNKNLNSSCQTLENKYYVKNRSKILNNYLGENQELDLKRTCKAEEKTVAKKDTNVVVKAQELVRICTQCLMTFKYKRHLDRHLEGHQKNNCPHCSAKFARRKHLDVHLFRSHGKRATRYLYSCDLCSRSFPKRVLLNCHREKHNVEDSKTCSKCKDTLKTDTDHKTRMEGHNDERQFKCEQCLQALSTEETYLVHIQNYNTHRCSECNDSFTSRKKVDEHFKTFHSPKPKDLDMATNGLYFCVECRHGFMKKASYFRHLESAVHHHKVNEEVLSKVVFKCPICSKQLMSRRARDQHVRRVHKDEKRFACNTYGCSFQCTNRSDLVRHEQLHVEERNVVCEHCGKAFTSVGILKDHVLYVHNKERQFVCEECGKAFKRNSLLNRHKLSHQQIRPFTCVQCNAAFKRSHHLTRHMETCHRITLEKKTKVVKLMKMEDGQLMPIPAKPKKPKVKKVRAKKEIHSIDNPNLITIDKSSIIEDVNVEATSKEFQQVDSLCNSVTTLKTPDMQLPNLLPVANSVPQVLSLVDVNSGQIVTVEVANQDTLSLNYLVDQFEVSCNEMLDLPSYQDFEFQNTILSSDQSYYNHMNYSELPLENVEESSLLLDSSSSNSKIDTLPTIENYMTRPFSPFLNL